MLYFWFDILLFLLSLPYEQQLAAMDRVANERPEHFEDFQNILDKAVVPSVRQKFYCPLTVNLYTSNQWGCCDDDPEEYDGRFAARYADTDWALHLSFFDCNSTSG